LRQGLAHARELEPVRDGHDVVDHVVEFFGEGVDVLAVEGRDEAGVEPGEDFVGQAVTPLLALDDALMTARNIVEVAEEVLEATSRFSDVLRR
jgi:hypothetical protein